MRGYLIAAVLLVPFAAMAQTPKERANTARVGYASCVSEFKAGLKANNTQYPIQLMEKYCACTANKIATRIGPQDVAEFNANKGLIYESLAARMEDISNECITELGLQ
jgi:hypothetical protein